jgi:putative hydroxymethylpyrimidine transport system ATP-binding protein
MPSRETSPGIIVRNARFTYGGAPLFDGLSASVEGGKWTCVLGPSGVGKSSLIRLIAGLIEPEPETEIRASDNAPVDGRVAFMAQRDSLMPWLTARENVLLGPKLRGRRLDDALKGRATELLKAVGLAGKARSRPDDLSGGERQRVALARTLMEERPIVLMDEPFSALDAIRRHEIQALAARLLKGRTVLMVTHDPLEALRLGHAVHVMAGAPAFLDPDPIRPEGAPPRDPADPTVQNLYRGLLERLSAAREAA